MKNFYTVILLLSVLVLSLDKTKTIIVNSGLYNFLKIEMNQFNVKREIEKEKVNVLVPEINKEPVLFSEIPNLLNLNKKRKIKVMIIDTAIDIEHELLNPYFKKNKESFRLRDVKIDEEDLISTYGYHGTHVAGIIAFSMNFFGEDISDRVEFIPCNFFDPNEDDQIDGELDCLNQAISKKVDIVNFSAGGNHLGDELHNLEKEAFYKLQEHGILVVTSAGNDANYSGDYYPCNFGLNNIICVGNLDYNNELFYSSNFSNNVKFLSTGVLIYSSLPNNNYGYMTGTSQAAPFVTSLIIAKALGLEEDKIMELSKLSNTNAVLKSRTKIGSK